VQLRDHFAVRDSGLEPARLVGECKLDNEQVSS
jgi:hypothetical protein